MNWKNRLTNYNFWISIFSAVLLILQALKIEFDIAYVNEIFTAVLGLLVVIGIISDPTRTTVKTAEQTKNSTAEVAVNSENTIPTNKENEVDNDNLKNDLQTILSTISTDLDEKFEELKRYNLKTQKINATQYEEKIIEENKNELDINPSKEDSLPAVAEMDNPYIDVIN